MTVIEADPVAKGIRSDHIKGASLLFDQKVGTPGREVKILTNSAREVQIRYSETGLKKEDKKPL